MPQRYGRNEHTLTYQAGVATNLVVNSNETFVHGVTIGTAGAVATDFVEISDHASLGNGNIKMKLVAPAVGFYPINSRFVNGLTVNIAGVVANVTFHFDRS